MSETPSGPEYYIPPEEVAPPEVPPPPTIGDAAAAYDAAQYGGEQYEYQPPAPGTSAKKGLAVAALVVGLVALVTGWIPLWGLVPGIVAIVLGAVALAKKQSKGLAIGGIVTGGIGAVVSAAVLIAIIVFANGIEDASRDGLFTYGPAPEGQATVGPDSVDGGLSVADRAFGQTEYDDSVWWFAVVLDNPLDEGYAANDLTVNALDGDGNVLDSWWTYTTLQPGRNAVAGLFFDTGPTAIASLEVIAPTPDAAGATVASATSSVAGLTAKGDEWSTTVTGTVTAGDVDLAYPVITVLAIGAEGWIVDATTAYPNTVPAGSSAPFQADFYRALPETVTFEAYISGY